MDECGLDVYSKSTVEVARHLAGSCVSTLLLVFHFCAPWFCVGVAAFHERACAVRFALGFRACVRYIVVRSSLSIALYLLCIQLVFLRVLIVVAHKSGQI